MNPRTQNRKAISTVLTTLIILVASVVLGTGVVLYGTSLFKTGAQSSSLDVSGVQVWSDKGGSGWAWGAVNVRNSGDKLISVDTISIRGTSIPTANWYVDTNTTQVTTTNFQQSANYTGISLASNPPGKMLNYTGAASALSTATCPSTSITPAFQLNLVGTSASNKVLCLTSASGPITLQSGDKAIVYFKVPQNLLTTVDAGSSSSVAVYAGNVGAPQTVTVASK
ncbi:MAG: hypothetical protein ACYC6W_07300 [Nitrosotalea sp.]